MRDRNQNIVYLLLIPVLVGVLTACNPDRVLPKKEGLWQVVSIRDQNYSGNAVAIDTTFPGPFPEQYQFNKDGTGTFIDEGNTADFQWEYDSEKQFLTLDYNPAFQREELIVVERSKRKSQTWLIDSGFPAGLPDRTERTLELERVD